MILDAISAFLSAVLGPILSALPSGSSLGITTDVDGVFSNSLVSGVLGHFGWANAYLPLDSIITGFGLLVTLFIAMTAIRVLLWVLTKAHLLGGAG